MKGSIPILAMTVALAFPNGVKAGDDQNSIAFNTHCRTCHSLKLGDNRLGPSLFEIFGAEAGKVASHRGYSGALTGFVWDAATLDRFIADPAAVSTSTSMIYPPVKDPTERQRIIEFLETRSKR
jgi:cytochrome c